MISPPLPRYTIASLRQVGVSSLTPLHVMDDPLKDLKVN